LAFLFPIYKAVSIIPFEVKEAGIYKIGYRSVYMIANKISNTTNNFMVAIFYNKFEI
jgi:hypothetical protein